MVGIQTKGSNPEFSHFNTVLTTQTPLGPKGPGLRTPEERSLHGIESVEVREFVGVQDEERV